MYILGINQGHNASAALLKDGQITAFIHQKQAGFPKKSIEACLKKAKINISDIDLMVFGAKNPMSAVWLRTNQKSEIAKNLRSLEDFISDVLAFFYNPLILNFYSFFYSIVFSIYSLFKPFIAKTHYTKIAKELTFPLEKMVFLDHHLAHGYAAGYIFGASKEKKLVITNDGAGDGTCGKVFIVDGSIWQEIAQTPNKYSLAYLYYYVTKLLGFIPDQDENKVMNLASSASKKEVDKIYPIFKNLFWLENLSFKSRFERVNYLSYLKANLSGASPKNIAGTIQRLVEELTIAQVKKAISKTGIRQVALGGGLALNSKANKKIAKIPKIKLQVCPLAGDQSVSIGACFWGYYSRQNPSRWEKECIKIRRNLWLRKRRLNMFDLKAQDNILEIGCGDGLNLSILHKWGFKNLTGVDISNFLIKKARKNASGVKFILTSSENLPFKDSWFDTVLIDSSFYHFFDDQKSINEIKRVLRKKGRLVFSEAHNDFPRKVLDFLTLSPIFQFIPYLKLRKQAYMAEKDLLEAWLLSENLFLKSLEKNGFKKRFLKLDLLSIIGSYQKI